MSRTDKSPASGCAQRRRRFAKWLTLLVAIPLLLLSGYIGAWLLYTGWWSGSIVVTTLSSGNGGIRNVVIVTPRGGYAIPQLFGPIHRHIAAGRPGAKVLVAMQNEVIKYSRPAPLPPPTPVSPMVEEIDRLLMDVPQ
jgi:hypothetical protein